MGYIVGMDVSSVHTSPKFTLGSVGIVAASGTTSAKKYKYVQYKEATAATDGVSGEVAAYYQAGGFQDNVVTSDYSDSVNVGAGVLQANMSDDEYGWIQISGPATLTINLTAGSDGNALTVVGAGDGTLDVSAAVTDHICAIADDASADEIVCCFPE